MSSFSLAGSFHGEPLRIDLAPGSQFLGRSETCDIRLSDPAISRRHARILVENGSVYIYDLDSRNGTLLNEHPVKEARVKPMDVIQIGPLNLTLLADGSSGLSFAGETTRTRVESSPSVMEQSEAVRTDRILNALYDLGQMLSKKMELEEVYQSALDVLERFVPSRRILILRCLRDREEPIVASFRLFDGSLDDPLLISKQMMADILVKGRCLLTDDAAKDGRWDPRASIRKMGVHAAMGAPLAYKDRTLGAIYMDAQTSQAVFKPEDLQLLTLVANMVAVKITNSRLEEEEVRLESLQHEIDVAERIQMNLLPRRIPEVPGYGLYANVIPCEKVGGDLYDFRVLPDGKLCLALGDVSGHGVGAALLMSHVLAGLRYLEDLSQDPVALVTELERKLSPNLEAEQFVTLFVGLLDPAAGVLTYVNAGHWPPMILGGASCRKLDATGLPVGLLQGTIDRTMGECRMGPGSALLVVSDGVPECQSQNEEFYLDRLQMFIEDKEKALPVLCAEDIGKDLLEDIRRFHGTLPAEDDLTLLVMKREDG